ncbi:carbohydrate kinase family protein [Paenibacillus sp. strain BS8-2]
MRDQTYPYPAIVGGHICLDIIPAIQQNSFELVPGKLLNTGQVILATGGAVANTGIALHRLGAPVRLMGKLGKDHFGEVLRSIIREQDERLTENMILVDGESSSYTIVISPPKVDRMFLHCTGANDTFCSNDISEEALLEAGLFHFGYPPLMRRMYENEGAELADLMKRAKSAGATTSLDLAKPDPASASGAADWRRILERTLPDVDVFLPSVEEVLYMLHREQYEVMQEQYGSEGLLASINSELLESLSAELLDMGVAIVVLKLGEFGLFMRTAADQSRLQTMGRYTPSDADGWQDRTLYAPCFRIEAAGTTGAGDCTIAGFLSGLMQGRSPEAALIGAVGTGACSVERQDATSGIPPWTVVERRIASGWEQHGIQLSMEGYSLFSAENGTIYRSPIDTGE